MNSATRLKNLRERYNLSQNEVARILNVSPSLISSYERGERTPSPHKLSSLADIYHTTTDYLLGRSSHCDDEKYISVDGLTPKQIKLLRELIDTMKE